MADIGKITPAFDNSEEVRQWRVPIHVFLEDGDVEFKVTSIYEDEGHLCIDVAVNG